MLRKLCEIRKEEMRKTWMCFYYYFKIILFFNVFKSNKTIQLLLETFYIGIRIMREKNIFKYL